MIYPKLISDICLTNDYKIQNFNHSIYKDWQSKHIKDIIDH